jgi:hypothetical protein
MLHQKQVIQHYICGAAMADYGAELKPAPMALRDGGSKKTKPGVVCSIKSE